MWVEWDGSLDSYGFYRRPQVSAFERVVQLPDTGDQTLNPINKNRSGKQGYCRDLRLKLSEHNCAPAMMNQIAWPSQTAAIP